MDASELYDPEFRKLIKSKKPTVIIPVGSLEQHGAHLPITTDSDIVTEIASRLAKKCGFIVFPTIGYGLSREHSPLFNTSSKYQEFAEFLREIFYSLFENKIESVIILNGHHGNVEALKNFTISDDAQYYKERGGKLPRVYSYWRFMEHEFDHAGFVETSLMLAISDKVKMKKAKKGLITKGLSEKEIQRINKLSRSHGDFLRLQRTECGVTQLKQQRRTERSFLQKLLET